MEAKREVLPDGTKIVRIDLTRLTAAEAWAILKRWKAENVRRYKDGGAPYPS